MSLVIAFCTDSAVFVKNKILDDNVARNYPGALWVTYLAKFSKELELEVVTGDIAFARIQKKLNKPSDFFVIQEETCSQGFDLLDLGAKPFLLICAESPLYARNFYANLSEISIPFKNRILFRGAFALTSLGGSNHALHFPSFSLGQKQEAIPWPQRRFLVMVAANKYWHPRKSIIRQVAASVRNLIMRRKSYVSSEINELQLHDRRLELIEYFGRSDNFDLFGPHWGDISNLPAKWRDRLRKIVVSLNPAVCTDKCSIISRYKFAICFENMSYPGYVTEKIIDCFSASVIPIYMGAPDICDFIPREAFIDLREFGSLDILNRYLTEMTESVALSMVAAGHKFLSSTVGAQYSYEGFARNVLSMVNEYE